MRPANRSQAEVVKCFRNHCRHVLCGLARPGYGGNAILNESSAVIDQLLTKPKKKTVKQASYLNVPVGTEFHPVVSSLGKPNENHGNAPSGIDRILEQTLQQRLKR